MTVRKIVLNIAAPPGQNGAAFYEDLLGLNCLMDLGWITTWGHDDATASPQISVASEGGGGAAVPDMSIEVDDLDAIWARAQAGGYDITYPLTVEPWGVRRFMVRDPFGKIVNILAHD